MCFIVQILRINKNNDDFYRDDDSYTNYKNFNHYKIVKTERLSLNRNNYNC